MEGPTPYLAKKDIPAQVKTKFVKFVAKDFITKMCQTWTQRLGKVLDVDVSTLCIYLLADKIKVLSSSVCS